MNGTAVSQMLTASGIVGTRQLAPFTAGGPSKAYAQRCQAARVQRQTGTTACRAQQHDQAQAEALLSRRSALLSAAAVPLLGLTAAAPAPADALPLKEYRDGPDEFTVQIPEDWSTGEGQAEGGRGYTGATGARRAIAWYPEGEIQNTSVSVVITNVGADFTKLGSFGTASAFGENLVASMDRRFMRRASWGPKGRQEPIQEAELLAAREGRKGGANLYYVDYELLKPGEDEKRVFMSAVALGFNGRYNRLFTLTAQCLKKDLPRVGQDLQIIVASFTPPTPVV